MLQNTSRSSLYDARMSFPKALVVGLALGACAPKVGEPSEPDAAPPSAGPTEAHETGHHQGKHPQGHHGPHTHAMGGMPHRFEDAEAWAEHFDDPARDAWQKPDAVVAALKLAPNAKVADIGAGTGYFTVRLAAAVPEGTVYAGDIEPDMVRYVGERATRTGLENVIAVQGEPDDPKLPEPVDLVLMVDVYHHIDERIAYFEGLAHQLTDGGRIVIVDFKADAPADAPGPPPQHRIAQAEVVAELEEAGLQLVEANRDLLPFQYMLTFRRG